VSLFIRIYPGREMSKSEIKDILEHPKRVGSNT
jgi:hypothetical protein